MGKTYAVFQLGRSFENMVTINFEEIKNAKNIFEKDLVAERILNELSLLTGQPIIPGRTLLFLDEIQECPEAILALRYFYESMPLLHVIAAGSLLDFAIQKVGVPVGRVSMLYMGPLSFIEFLVAINQKMAAKAILEQKNGVEMSPVIHRKLLDLVGQYLAIGGIPEAVFKWVETSNALESFDVHYQLASTYRQDFPKYAKKHQIKYLEQLFNQIPHLIGEQFKYSAIHGEYQKRELAPCLDLLCHTNIVHRVHHSAGNGMPLGGEINFEWFKLIFLDVALSQAVIGTDRASWFLDPQTTFVNQGSLVEAFVGQELLAYSAPQRKNDLYFWKRDKRGSQAKIDFVYEYQSKIIPVEVKSDQGSSLKSMHAFLECHPHSPYGIRFSSLNYSIMGKIGSRPLYAVCSLAQESQREALLDLVS